MIRNVERFENSVKHREIVFRSNLDMCTLDVKKEKITLIIMTLFMTLQLGVTNEIRPFSCLVKHKSRTYL